jgi:arylsulfatase A-like enzyme
MHMFTHTKPESVGQAGRWQSRYHDTMIDHDRNVGDMLNYLDQLGITDTFVMYSTDNGPQMNSWPDSGMTPFRSEKNTNWEGAFRVPMLVRWPGRIEAGSVANGIAQHHDWLPTFLAMAGESDIVEKLKKGGYKANGRTFKNHIDGVNLLPYLTGQVKESPRNCFFYFSDDGDMLGMRYDNWKIVFMEQRCAGTLQVWAEPFTRLRVPKFFNMRIDPYERADITSNTYYDWMLHNAFFILAAQAAAAKFAATFKEFPPVQRPASFTIDEAIEKMSEAA